VKVAVLGVGLIGGSIGLAARRRVGARVVGYDPDTGVLARAVEVGAIDESASGIAEAVDGADIVFVATPVGASVGATRQALAAATPECIVSDVGSTKREIARAISDPRFLGGHPLAGAETAGVEHAREDLFEGAVWCLTPPAEAPSPASGRLRELIERVGARPMAIDPDAHDRLMASVSHLPHVLANVLVAQARQAARGDWAGEGSVEGGIPGAGPSFRDATRVAGANTAIWTDIYMSNRDALIAALDDAVERLGAVRTALADGDAGALAAWNERARVELGELQSPGPAVGS
jgi:prephenate dehydrogenase